MIYRGYEIDSQQRNGYWVRRPKDGAYHFATEIEAMQAIDAWKRQDREEAAERAKEPGYKFDTYRMSPYSLPRDCRLIPTNKGAKT